MPVTMGDNRVTRGGEGRTWRHLVVCLKVNGGRIDVGQEYTSPLSPGVVVQFPPLPTMSRAWVVRNGRTITCEKGKCSFQSLNS